MSAAVVIGQGPAVSGRHLFDEARRAITHVWENARAAGDHAMAKRAERAIGELLAFNDEPTTGRTLRGVR